MSEENAIKAEVKKNSDISRIGLWLIAGGVVLLALNLMHISLMHYLWPVLFFIGPGLLLMWPAYQSTSQNRSQFAFLAVPGAMVTFTGVLLAVMNLFNHFDSWAYAWPLILAAGAYGYDYMYRFDDNPERKEKTYRFIRAMVILFMALAVVFELLIFHSLGAWWPLLLIGFGIYIYFKNRRLQSNE